ncbi:bifunctional diguanylate cyclase/phosphodiesterase [Ruminococcus flavefaciens]|uniref:Diguanylate cyclase (GGDEF)-like protein n=1 Tax=Ruminococcus flavefaciens TaxID=1265 RepID=A0A315XSR6_RUMFL|nr:bifunctional diguanylate cyclase/phosphodiesterase [Ruminococcus flavefaciens]PWJ09705.1 diguanylate cyclase (GGDEF)-like protein [Ruminococcus flavefaciens]SSA52270.1 diguanylate cyclase (GGDEF) domain-containing protein [Ruminococcus flavefaciens]
MKAILNGLGFEKNSKYVRDYFFTTNMRASIYMSLVVIVLEVWMIIRMTVTIFRDNLQSNMMHYIEKYYVNYFILTFTGIIMLILAVRFMRGKKDNRYLCTVVKWVFTLVCIYFGIKISLNDYSKGEQILTFLTMELFSLCLLTWKPYIAFVLASASYVYFYYRMNEMVAVNTGEVGTTVATQINFFIMWISTMMVCIANYNNTRMQALKDENLEKVNTYLSKISIEDELTGIHNMVYFRNEAEKVLSYVTTDRENAVFLFFDIENFKSYNEKYGFHEGNELLIKVAHMIEDSFKGSLVSRFSDDHFVVLTRIDGAKNIIGHLSGEIKKLQREVHLELKCGAYKPVGDEADVSLACDRARFACNSIKKHYDRTLRIYDKSLEDKFQLKHYIVNNIDNAIASGYIKVYYQPVVSTKNGCICGLEALARWEDPNYGLLSPGAFIEILEEYRQIYKLDQYIIEAVCRDYRDASDNKKPFAPVSLNFSRLDFELCDIVGYLCETVEKYGVPKNFIDIEITESALTDQQDFLPNAIKNLRSFGYKVWLDDFGSGYSSLNVLKDYQFDVLKIDMKFLSGFKDNEKTRPILENIVSLTKQLKMLSLTEGVETAEQFSFLETIGCDRAQGYLFSKPVPIETLRERISAGELKISPELSA